MPRISVLVPTHEHASTLSYAVRSVQTQSVDDLEILICGDGVNDEIRAVIAGAAARRPAHLTSSICRVLRISASSIAITFYAEPRARLSAFTTTTICGCLGISRCWSARLRMPICRWNQVNVGTDGKVRGDHFDLERPEFVKPWLNWKPNYFGSWACNGFGPIFVAYRLDAYLRLPEGWTTTPTGLPSDQVMWHKFMGEPWCRARFLRWPIALHFAASDRIVNIV